MIIFSVIMIVLGIISFVLGVLIYKGHDKIIKRGYLKKASKKKMKYIGQTIMLISVSPLLSALVAMISTEKEAFILAGATLIISSILSFVVTDKYIKIRK